MPHALEGPCPALLTEVEKGGQLLPGLHWQVFVKQRSCVVQPYACVVSVRPEGIVHLLQGNGWEWVQGRKLSELLQTLHGWHDG